MSDDFHIYFLMNEYQQTYASCQVCVFYQSIKHGQYENPDMHFSFHPTQAYSFFIPGNSAWISEPQQRMNFTILTEFQMLAKSFLFLGCMHIKVLASSIIESQIVKSCHHKIRLAVLGLEILFL